MLKVGDKIPSVKVKVAGETGGGDETTTEALFAGKKVVLFGVPGAFTPTCSAKHLPGFVTKAEEFKKKGVDMIACVSVNDAFVMGAWGKDQGAHGKVTLIADGNADLAKAMGLELDLQGSQMGVRNKRYAAVIENGVVRCIDVEQPGIAAQVVNQGCRVGVAAGARILVSDVTDLDDVDGSDLDDAAAGAVATPGHGLRPLPPPERARDGARRDAFPEPLLEQHDVRTPPNLRSRRRGGQSLAMTLLALDTSTPGPGSTSSSVMTPSSRITA